MLHFSNSHCGIGLEFSSFQLKGAKIVLKKGKPFVEELLSQDIPQTFNSHDVKQLYIKALEDEGCFVSTGLKGGEVLIRSIHVPLTKDKDIKASLGFQAEPLLPYPLEMAIIDSIKQSQSSQGTDLTLLSIKKSHLEKHLHTFRELNIEPEIISCVPIALARYSKLFDPPSGYYLVSCMTDNDYTCSLVKEGQLIASYSLNQGTSVLFQAYCKEKDLNSDKAQTSFLEVDFSKINALTSPELFNASEGLRKNVIKIIYSLSKEVKNTPPATILLAGESHLLKGFESYLYKDLDLSILLPPPQVLYSSLDLLTYAIPIGLATEALIPAGEIVNFRQHDFAYPYVWKRYKRPLAIYGMLCFALALAICFFTNSYIGYQENKAKQDYIDLLRDAHKTYRDFEVEFLAKFPKEENSGEFSILPIEALTIEDINQRILLLQKDFKVPTDAFPYYPNTPRVSDLLAWISNHPKVTGDHSTDEKKPLIEIENLNYTMVKRPEPKKRQEKYQVKVELEFSSATPKWAREFHDALIAPNEIVDPKGEVKWNANRGKYKTSFYLKDKTIYPTN